MIFKSSSNPSHSIVLWFYDPCGSLPIQGALWFWKQLRVHAKCLYLGTRGSTEEYYFYCLLEDKCSWYTSRAAELFCLSEAPLGAHAQVWGPQQKDVDLLELVQRMAMEMAMEWPWRGAGALLLWRKAEGVHLVQPGEGKASKRSHWGSPVFKGRL